MVSEWTEMKTYVFSRMKERCRNRSRRNQITDKELVLCFSLKKNQVNSTNNLKFSSKDSKWANGFRMDRNENLRVLKEERNM